MGPSNSSAVLIRANASLQASSIVPRPEQSQSGRLLRCTNTIVEAICSRFAVRRAHPLGSSIDVRKRSVRDQIGEVSFVPAKS